MKKILLFLFLSVAINGLFAQVVINEVVYDPTDNDGSSPGTGEWIELYCPLAGDCDISCMVITDGDWTIQIPDGTTITAGDFFVIGTSGSNTGDPGTSVPVDLDADACGCTTGSSVMVLTNSGESVGLYDDMGGFLDGVVFDGPSSGNDPCNASDLTSNAANGCGAVTTDIDGNCASYVTVAGGGENVRRDIDGPDGGWEYETIEEATPGSTNEPPMPVALASFTAKPMDNEAVSLDWATSSEENNEYFSIEHSTDGRDFAEVGMIEGALNSTTIQNYNFMHKEATKGMNYYRLRQVDTDGTFSFSSVEVVSLSSDVAVDIRPTLADATVAVVLNETFDTEMTIEVYDILGRVVSTEVLSRGNIQMTLNVQDLQKGHYLVRVSNGLESYTKRFIKR